MSHSHRPAGHILILGGTTEAKLLAQQLTVHVPGCRLTMSLAGRTRSPLRQPIPTRTGGFGGVEGLARWLIEHQVSLLIIATHPFAAQMPVNAVAAARQAGIPSLRLLRPAWLPEPGADWHRCDSLSQAVQRLGEAPQRVFLPIGRQSAASFAAAPQHTYLVRSIEPLDDDMALPHIHSLLARGPFSLHEEETLMTRWCITRMVCKNSGGHSMAAKLQAAHTLDIPVIMVERPRLPINVSTFESVTSLIRALPHFLAR
ncbi:cobalt-precorrin-6A reductase [Zymobacter palmae]|uniref:Precorrin-6x reductase n=1 Tax=Zymobacter palmae TaxID=33074 RepID=A0A348HDD0_9GAMM|nr:cobalt-precorrin-6A reductase [Zymobacter palmae]BBG29632.1 precorrin-6x reductase [Zymobacter palmae]